MYSPFNDYWLSRIDGFRPRALNGLQAVPEKRLVSRLQRSQLRMI
jgi:hypothetical protein